MSRIAGNLLSTAAAAEKLGVSSAQFLRIAKARGATPDKTYKNPHYRSGPPAGLWAPTTLARLARTKDVAAARESKGGKPPKDYVSVFEKRYGNPEAALPAACEALFNLNRYTRHPTCSGANRTEILDLKTKLVEHLYSLEKYTDRVEKLTKTLPAKECFDCEGAGCERCDHTGEYAPARDVASYVFTFGGFPDGQRYTWMQPDHVMTFEPRVEATRADDGKPRELEKTLNIPRSKLAEAKALVRFALRPRAARTKRQAVASTV